MSDKEKMVFAQEVSREDMKSVAGGRIDLRCGSAALENRSGGSCRDIYGGTGFPNCARTVEEGSWCRENDACYAVVVDYQEMTECGNAWR